MDNIEELKESTKTYLEFCEEEKVVPAFSSLARWCKCDIGKFYVYAREDTPRGVYLREVKTIISEKITNLIIEVIERSY